MTQPAHVLVIDDEQQILRAVRTILTAKQFRVTTAARGEEGLTLAAAQAPDLIILDLTLPDRPLTPRASGPKRWSIRPRCRRATPRRGRQTPR